MINFMVSSPTSFINHHEYAVSLKAVTGISDHLEKSSKERSAPKVADSNQTKELYFQS
jgi:hypothetical protein